MPLGSGPPGLPTRLLLFAAVAAPAVPRQALSANARTVLVMLLRVFLLAVMGLLGIGGLASDHAQNRSLVPDLVPPDA